MDAKRYKKILHALQRFQERTLMKFSTEDIERYNSNVTKGYYEIAFRDDELFTVYKIVVLNKKYYGV